RTAAVRHIVHDTVTIGREFAQVTHLHVEEAARDRAADDPRRERLLDHRREDRDNVERHDLLFKSSNPSGGSITIRLPARSIVRQISPTSGIRTSPSVPAITSRLPLTVPSTSSTTPTAWPAIVCTSQPIRS